MQKEYPNIDMFIQDIKKESLKEVLIGMDVLRREDIKNSKFICLFHDEDTASMQVTDTFFKCYGCGAKGDLIKFIQLFKNLTFYEAVSFLSDYFQVHIKHIVMSSKLQGQISDWWSFFLKEFRTELSKNSNESKKLKELAKKFFPLEIGFDSKNLRLVLAFTSKTKKILGFTKRAIFESETKWLHSHSKHTLIGQCHLVFNLGGAWEHIQKTKSVYIVEGPGDAASMIRAGYLNTVAICSTNNFNTSIIEMLLVKSIKLAFDNDEAGKQGMLRAAIIIAQDSELFLNSYVFLIKNKDPGDASVEELSSAKEEKLFDWFIENADFGMLRNLYMVESEVLKPKVLANIARKQGMSLAETAEWLRVKRRVVKKDKHLERLLATVGKASNMDTQALSISEEEAKKILKMRYKINIS